MSYTVKEPVEFYDAASDRSMLIRMWGRPPTPWLFYKHPDGQWVSLRKATDEDLERIGKLAGWPA